MDADLKNVCMLHIICPPYLEASAVYGVLYSELLAGGWVRPDTSLLTEHPPPLSLVYRDLLICPRVYYLCYSVRFRVSRHLEGGRERESRD